MKLINKVFILIFTLLLGILVYYFYPEAKFLKNTQIDRLVVYKSKRQLLAFSNGKLLKTYKISLGRQPLGAKEIEGDMKTPEGVYVINDKNPHSGWHKNLGISYPNSNDISRAKSTGKSTGGDIKIHGLNNKKGYIGKFHRWSDWTLGCIAVTNEEVDELYKYVKIGSQIEIKP